LQEEAKYVRH